MAGAGCDLGTLQAWVLGERGPCAAVCRSRCCRRADALVWRWRCRHCGEGSGRSFHPRVRGSCCSLCPALSPCPMPQRIPGIAELASRLSQPRSSHERPFLPAGSGCELARSHRSSRAVATVTLLPVWSPQADAGVAQPGQPGTHCLSIP